MTPIEEQQLKNQSTIIMALSDLSTDLEITNSLKDRMAETLEFFIESKEEPCCEMPDRIDGYMETLKDKGIDGLRNKLHGEFAKNKDEVKE